MVYFYKFLNLLNHKSVAALITALLLSAFAAPSTFAEEHAKGEPEYTCITCHLEMDDVLKEVVVDWKKSVHAQAGVMCHDCHGGDPVDPDLAMDEEAGFRPKPEPDEVPAFCARCHSDARKMRAYNLPSDQFEKFSRSVHGKKLLEEKDFDAPNCVSCHGKHAILKVADPESMVHRNNILQTCAGCHSKKSMMEKRGLPFNQYELYKTSVHGKPFFEKGDLGVPTCINCHSNHEIIKPQTARIRLVCTECHLDQEEMYKKGGHWESAQQSGEPYCVDCHSNHAIEKPTSKKFVDKGELNCVGCHQKNSIQMEKAASIFKMLEIAKLNINSAQSSIDQITSKGGSGFETSHLVAKTEKGQKMLKEMAIETHSLNVRGIRGKAKKIKNIKKEVEEATSAMRAELLNRKRGLIFTWVIFFVFSWVLYKRSSYCKRD